MKVFIGPYKKSGTARNIQVQIHDYDIISMDHTLALIIVPMLKLLREKKQGAPYVDNDDVPENLRSYYVDDGAEDPLHFARWEYVLDEMIFAFESNTYDWEDQFHSGNPEYIWTPVDAQGNDDPNGEFYRMNDGPNSTHIFDTDGWKKMHERIHNGYRLFGKYYSGLWT